ncbi:phenazine biosynthesis protein PhzF [Aureimonas endophytica]|uniref:Phenazine biosynthesis protein PhzF n=1 Tax=Aureimonas endophytica TaxID=2027858 RepID=A0A917A1A5_9HYPH|nr:PhzF family phenazine biosynthesis protein [Aureimonas endophytica]GGE21987.1 phenazine biosynthesis protein PhzF [Aureimonas endophytica]
MKRRFIQCDVFSAVPTRGNGLAVVVDGEGLSDAEMQRFAAWTNLAETTFLLPPETPEADYRVRIFTVSRELPFAGHPTLGSCMAWLAAGGRPKRPGTVRQECAVGLVEVEIGGAVPAFRAPPTTVAPLEPRDVAALAAALGLDAADVRRAARLVNGPVWHVLELADAAKVLAVDPSRARWPEDLFVGLIGAHPPGGECDFEVRMFELSNAVIEDPITGSLNAAIAQWMRAEGRLDTPLTIAQGTAIGRLGRVHIRPDGEGVLIGGAVSLLIEGALDL